MRYDNKCTMLDLHIVGQTSLSSTMITPRSVKGIDDVFAVFN